MNMKIPAHLRRQQGVSLVVTLVLVVLLSLLALYGAGVLVMDTRSAANDYRAKEALAAAEAGLEQGYSLLSTNSNRIRAIGLDLNSDGDTGDANESAWTACTAAATTAPCVAVRAGDRANWSYLTVNAALTRQPTLGSFALHLMSPTNGNGKMLVYNIVASGNAAENTTNTPNTIVKQGAYFYPLILSSIDSPLAATANISLSGNYSIITNANGGGSGVPVTAWSAGTITPSGSFTSCYAGDFVGSACPSSAALSKNGLSGPDLVANDSAFPPDLFKYLFGVPEADFAKIRAMATVVADCNGLGPTSSGFYWVTGNCNPPNNNIGTPEYPVLLVVEGDATVNSSIDIYGLLFMFNSAGAVQRIISNGGPTLHGAIMGQDEIDFQLTGGFVLEYNSAVLAALLNNMSTRRLSRLPGGWSDVQ